MEWPSWSAPTRGDSPSSSINVAIDLRKLCVVNATLLGAGTEDAQQRLLGLPVVVARFAPLRSGFVIDSTAIAAAVGPVRVATSEHTYFSSDSIALRATWRIGWNVVRDKMML